MRTVIIIFLLATGPFCMAQKGQVSFHLNSGLFSYGGSSAVESSFVNVSDVLPISAYTNNPYGTKSSFSWGVAAQIQRITKRNFIYGIQIGYESLSSRVDLDQAWSSMAWSVGEGKTILTTNFLNLNPAIGKRFKLFNGVDTDLLAGFDFGIGLSSKEHYDYTPSQGDKISGTHDREEPNLDIRPRIEIANYFKNIGFSIGYSYGLTNYQAEMDGANKEVFSRYLRLGISYRLNQNHK